MKPLVSSVTCEVHGTHCHVTVWSRGGNAGKLVLNSDDGIKLAKMLIPSGCELLEATGLYRRWALAEAVVTVGDLVVVATEDDDDSTVPQIKDSNGNFGSVDWDGERFGKWPFSLDLRESTHEAIADLLAIRFAEAKRVLEAA